MDSVNVIAVETPTYNLSVEGFHTYFVVAGKTPVLVHNVDPWEIAFSRVVKASETFQLGKHAGRTLSDLIAETKALGRLPEGLELRAARITLATGEEVIVAINNRTLFVAQEAGLSQVRPANAIDSAGASRSLQRQFALARKWGGDGLLHFRGCP